jgi:hypothetical protein
MGAGLWLLTVAALACEGGPVAPTPARFGALLISTTATGPLDPAATTIRVDVNRRTFEGVLINSSLIIDSLAPGPVTLAVKLGTALCSIPQNPIAIEILAADTARVDLDITCVSPTGTLVVSNTTTGPPYPGPSDIELELSPTRFVSLRLNSSVTIDSLPPGPLSLAVDLGRPHCTIPHNPVDIVIPAADTARVDLAITCASGTLWVGLPTTGPNQPSLLIITMDGAGLGGAAPNTVGLGFASVAAGPHNIGLTGFDSHCTLSEPNPQPVVVPADDSVRITFTLTCS